MVEAQRFLMRVMDVFTDAEDGERRWFHDHDFDVYLRMGPREFLGQRYHVLTLADVTVKEGLRGQGVFSELLVDIEVCARLLGCTGVLVENLRPELVNPLSKRRYRICRNGYEQFNALKELE